MASKSENMSDTQLYFADIVNECIREMLKDAANSTRVYEAASIGLDTVYREYDEESRKDNAGFRGYGSGFFVQFDLIRRSFTTTPSNSLQKEDIATRLSLIDLFYTTNFNRYAEFGLEELTDTIWNMCRDKHGNYSDAALVQQTESFVRDCSVNPVQARQSAVYSKLFSSNAKFGLAQAKKQHGEEFQRPPLPISALSLISKYLFFLLETHHSTGNYLGFPIYDSIARNLQGHLLKKLDVRRKSGDDMVGYVDNMRSILNRLTNLSTACSSVWHMPASVCNTQFGLLDYFLWHVGKSGGFSFSLLWTRDEKKQHYKAVPMLQDKIKDKTFSIAVKEFRVLPLRFKKWHNMYGLIKTK